MSATDKNYLSCAETAKLVRKALKADFPGTKFSVRSSTYAGGASIDVSWTDGPMVADVDRTLSLYSGASFDGMTDMKSYHDSMLMTEGGPQVVHFGADFVHSNRRISDARAAVYRHEVRRFLASLGEDVPALGHDVRIPVSGRRYCGDDGPATLSHDPHGGEYATTVIHQLAYGRPWKDERCPGSQDAYCSGCGRWQKGHEKEPHKR